MSSFIANLVSDVLKFVLQTWFTMLLLGGVHHDVDARVPALGLWQTALVVLLVGSLLGNSITTGVKYGIQEARDLR